MTEVPFRVEILAGHDRSTFDCGVQPLNHYFQTQVSQDVRRNVAHCFVVVDALTGQIAAYYTLAASSCLLAELPTVLVKKLPRSPTVPAALIGRLAVDTRYQGKRLGAALLGDAVERVLRSGPAVYALIVDAKDERAAAFYRKFGFIAFDDSPLRLFLPVSVAQQSLTQAF